MHLFQHFLFFSYHKKELYSNGTSRTELRESDEIFKVSRQLEIIIYDKNYYDIKKTEYYFKINEYRFCIGGIKNQYDQFEEGDELLEATENVKSLAGIHLEGPYINKIYKGAQNEDFIRKPSVEEYIIAHGGFIDSSVKKSILLH